jgi:hypothetical protein
LLHPIAGITALGSLAALGENAQLKKSESAPRPRLDVPRISASYPTLSNRAGSEKPTQKWLQWRTGTKAKEKRASNTTHAGTAAKPCL